jgi:uncharacterized protein (TIGR02466 family)
MPIASYEVKPLFAEPYFRTNIASAITPDQVAWLKALPMVKNQINLISDDLYIFRAPEMRSIAEAVQESLVLYSRDVLGISHILYATQSWTLINPPGIGMHGHSHSNSIVSGSLYYTDLPAPPSRMVFERHNSYQQLELGSEADKANIYNAARNAIEPRRGDLILFSSSLSHFVEANTSALPRHAIAFNSFIRGTLGSYRDVSELRLEARSGE